MVWFTFAFWRFTLRFIFTLPFDWLHEHKMKRRQGLKSLYLQLFWSMILFRRLQSGQFYLISFLGYFSHRGDRFSIFQRSNLIQLWCLYKCVKDNFPHLSFLRNPIKLQWTCVCFYSWNNIVLPKVLLLEFQQNRILILERIRANIGLKVMILKIHYVEDIINLSFPPRF